MRHFRDFIRDNLSQLEPGRLLDVGAYDVNGNYRGQVPPQWKYIGLDIAHGPNVDIVCPAVPWPFKDGEFDAVVSGQCLEHTFDPIRLTVEMGRVVRRGGLIWLCAPWRWPVHKHPVDCWRILPDAMTYMLSQAGCQIVGCGISGDDCVAIGQRV